MEVKEKGSLFIICGASGVGKGTVIYRVLERVPRLKYSVSCTTRPARNGEIDCKDYYFISHEKFESMIKDDMFLEYARYVDDYYGTPREPVCRALEQGRDVLLEIDMQGALAIKEKMPDAVMIFIVAQNFGELEKRLRHRGTENEEKIRKRLIAAKTEYEKAKQFDYIVVNEIISEAVDEMVSIITAEHCRIAKRRAYLDVND